MSVIQLPLKHYGVQIGEVNIDEGGVMSIVLNGPNAYLGALGQDLHRVVEQGLVTGLNISPIMPPATPSKLENDGNNFGPRKPITS